MTASKTVIDAIAYENAPNIVTSEELEQRIAPTMERLSIPFGRMEELTGIQERRYFDPGTMPSDAATIAAEKVIAKTGIDRNEIGCLINTSICKDYIEPSVASLIHGNLKLPPTCKNFDITNACVAFVNGIEVMKMMIDSGMIKHGLIVNAETPRSAIEKTIEKLQRPETTMEDYFYNFASLTIGAGAVAMLVSHEDHAIHASHKVNGSVSLADTKHNRLCVATNDSMWTDASGLLKAGVALAMRTWEVAAEQLENWNDDSIDLYAPHQVSQRHINAFIKNLNISGEKVFLNLQKFGNIAPAALPISLAQAEEQGRMKTGDHVALMGIGSGLNCSLMSVSW